MINRKFAIRSALATTLFFALVLSLVRCAPNLPMSSNIPITEGEAQSLNAIDLTREAGIRDSIAAVRKALEPVVTAFREIDKIVNVTVNGKDAKEIARSKLHDFAERLRDELQQLEDTEKTRLRLNEDGSWELTRAVHLKIYRDGQSCDSEALTLKGEGSSGYNTATLSVVDCFSADARKIVQIQTFPSGKIQATYFKDGLEGLRPKEELAVYNDDCMIQIEKGGESQLSCRPMSWTVDARRMLFVSPVQLGKTAGSDWFALINADLMDYDTGKIRGIQFIKERGQSVPRVNYCDGGCV